MRFSQGRQSWGGGGEGGGLVHPTFGVGGDTYTIVLPPTFYALLRKYFDISATIYGYKYFIIQTSKAKTSDLFKLFLYKNLELES